MDEPDIEAQIGSSARTGVVWHAAGQVASRVLGLAFLVLLARLLTPADYGVVSFAVVVAGVGTVFADVGAGSAFIQHRGSSVVEASAAFFLNLTVAACVATILLVVALTAFHDRGELGAVLAVTTIAFSLRWVVATHDAYLRKTMRFRRLQAIGIASALVTGCVSVALAVANAGPWSLVIGQLAGNVVYASGAVVLAGMPLEARPHLALWGELFGFGKHILAAAIVWFVILNGDNFMVGRVLGASALGFYALAYSYGRLPQLLVGGAISDVLFAAMSRVRNDADRIGETLKRSVHLICVLALPSAALMAYIAPDVLTLVFGERWEPAAGPFRVFVVAFTATMFAAPCSSVYLATGRPHIGLLLALGTLPAFIAAVLIGVGVGIDLTSVLVSAVMVALALAQVPVAARVAGVSVIALMRAGLPGACVALVATLACLPLWWFALGDIGPLARIAVESIAFSLVALVTLRMGLPKAWRQLLDELRLIRGQRPPPQGS